MLKDQIRTIIFDIDGTLTDYLSWLKITEGLGLDTKKHIQIFEDMKEGAYSIPEAEKMLIEYWQSSRNADLTFLQNMFKNWILKQDAFEVIDYLNKKYRICLISGAVDLYVQSIADRLDIEDWYANSELLFSEAGKIEGINYSVDQASKKVRQFRHYMRENNLEKSECLVIGDGDSDIGLFKELEYGIAVVNKDYPMLEKLAYKIIENLSDLKNIL